MGSVDSEYAEGATMPKRPGNSEMLQRELRRAYQAGRELRYVFQNCRVEDLPRYLEQFHEAACTFLRLQAELGYFSQTGRLKSNSQAIAALASFEAEMRMAEAAAAIMCGDAAREKQASAIGRKALSIAERYYRTREARTHWGKFIQGLKRLLNRPKEDGGH